MTTARSETFSTELKQNPNNWIVSQETLDENSFDKKAYHPMFRFTQPDCTCAPISNAIPSKEQLLGSIHAMKCELCSLLQNSVKQRGMETQTTTNI